MAWVYKQVENFLNFPWKKYNSKKIGLEHHCCISISGIRYRSGLPATPSGQKLLLCINSWSWAAKWVTASAIMWYSHGGPLPHRLTITFAPFQSCAQQLKSSMILTYVQIWFLSAGRSSASKKTKVLRKKYHSPTPAQRKWSWGSIAHISACSSNDGHCKSVVNIRNSKKWNGSLSWTVKWVDRRLVRPRLRERLRYP